MVITGADGFIGSNVVNKFLQEGKTVIAVDINETPKRLAKNKNLIYIQAPKNINELSEIIKGLNLDIDAILHFAWNSPSGEARKNLALQLQNAAETLEYLSMANKLNCKRFICAGSIMEHEFDHTTFQENPNAYAYAKLIAHNNCKKLASAYEIDLVWALIVNAFGVGENSPRFINSTIRKIINNEQELDFSEALNLYTFAYITDVANAFYLLAEKGQTDKEYTICGQEIKPLKEYINDLINTLNPNIKCNFGAYKGSSINVDDEVFDINTLYEDTGYKAQTSFIDGIRLTEEYLRGDK